jgi:hypothetical protein
VTAPGREIDEVARYDLMPEGPCEPRVPDVGPLSVGIDADGNSLDHDVQAAASEKPEEILACF